MTILLLEFSFKILFTPLGKSQDNLISATVQGDGGGPLLCLHSDQKYYVHGMVTAGIGCGLPGYPDFYSDVSQQFYFLTNSIISIAFAIATACCHITYFFGVFVSSLFCCHWRNILVCFLSKIFENTSFDKG